MRYAINYQAIKQDVFRGDAGPVTQGIILPGQIGYSAKYDPPNVYSPAKARALLKKSGVKLPIKGFFTTYNDSQDINVGQLIQEDLSKVGIDLQSRPLERGTLDSERILPTTPATILGASLSPDPNFLLSVSLISSANPPAGLDTARYSGIDKLYQEQSTAPTVALRVKYLHQIEQKLTQDVPAIVVDNQDDVWIVSNKVKDYYPTTLFSGDPLNLVKLLG
jgi:peptide/nickel transport system substrate-binding protein